MKLTTLEQLKQVELELAALDRLLDQETNSTIVGTLTELSGGAIGGGVGATGSATALYFAGVVGFSGAGLTSGLAAIGALVGGGMLAGLGVVVAAPLVLAGGGLFAVRHIRTKRFNDARKQLREHAVARRALLERLVRERDELGSELDKYREALARLTQLISELG
jgi:hypothetical protein